MRARVLVLSMFLVCGLSSASLAASLCTTNPCQTGGPTDFINWGAQGYGSPGTLLGTPQNWKSNGGQFSGVAGVVGPANFKLMQQGTNWAGNFSSGEYVIWNQAYASDNRLAVWLTAAIPNIVWEVVQIQASAPGPFVATVCEQGEVCFTENGYSDSKGDGSAIYIGIVDPNGVFDFFLNVVDANGQNNAAIGTVYFGYAAGATVPEPQSLMLLTSGLLSVFGVARRRLNR